MACACGQTQVRSAQGAQAAAAQGGGSAWVYEVTFSDGATMRVPTEQEAIAALSQGGGGYRQVRR